MKHLSVHSDGFGSNSFILDEEGNRIEGVTSASIWLEANEPTRIDLTIFAPRIVAQGHQGQVTLKCPQCMGEESHECEPNTLSGA